MTGGKATQWFSGFAVIAAGLLFGLTAAQADTPGQLLQELNDYPHARSIDYTAGSVIDYEVGLGAIRKVGGAWKFKRSERFNGVLTSYSWQIVDGFTSIEVMDELVEKLEQSEGAQSLFSCASRSCGQGVQWANRIFHQPVLYGREELQRYRVFSVGENPRQLVIIYSSARTADRQYLHVELLELAPES